MPGKVRIVESAQIKDDIQKYAETARTNQILLSAMAGPGTS